VEYICDRCFAFSASLSTVTFASGCRLKKIDLTAFLGCSGLQAIEIPANVEEIADLAAVTKPYFIKIFKSEFGFSPIQYINKKKVERAQLLLYTTEQTVKEVAYALGFCDQNYFIRLFRKVTGITPQKYRKILRA
jgi:AraC-like DNA-binding protein